MPKPGLDAVILAADIKVRTDAKLQALLPVGQTLDAARDPIRNAMYQALAEAVVAHFQAYANVVVDSVGGVQTGSGVSGPGTGSLT